MAIVDAGPIGSSIALDLARYGIERIASDQDQEYPAFVILRQYNAEAHGVGRAGDLDSIDVRWRNRAVQVVPQNDRVMLDVDNLVRRLALIMSGEASDAFLDRYDEERCRAADENIRRSAGSTEFISPKRFLSKWLRDATLEPARDGAN